MRSTAASQYREFNMFQGYPLAAFLLAIGIVLIVAELLLPSHGILGVGAALCILGAIFVCSRRNAWSGLALLLVVVAATPFAWTAFIKIWPRTPIGRRVVLPPVQSDLPQATVHVGQAGVAVSELRPMGTCDFDGVRVEALSEHGIVAAGTGVKVIAMVNNRPTVRVNA